MNSFKLSKFELQNIETGFVVAGDNIAFDSLAEIL